MANCAAAKMPFANEVLKTPTDTDSVPGGPRGNPSFTASIQNFTLTVPEGWTLIDQWPLGVSMAVGPTTTSSCVGEAIPVSDGQHAAAAEATPVPIPSPDCTEATTQTTEPFTIPEGGLPMLTLSNRDPGLGGSVCNAGGSLPATSATLYVALDYGATRTPGWERTVPSWPDPLGNVLAGDVPVGEMPCGPGGYSRFQAGGMPFIAWAGFGSEVTDADLQTVVDVFNGMRVSDAEIGGPSDDTPGYVLTGTPDWSVEARPTDVNVDMGYREPGGSSSGVGHFSVPDVPIEFGVANGTVFGAVTFDAERVELRPADGSAPVPGTILRLPGSLGAPFDAFVITSGATGEVVAVGPDGDLGSTPTDGTGTSEPTASVSSAVPAPSGIERTIATGMAFDGTWALTANPDTTDGYCVNLRFEAGNAVGSSAGGSCSVEAPGPGPSVAVIHTDRRSSFIVVVVPRDVDRVQIDSGDATFTEQGRGPAPSSFGEFDLAVVPLSADARGGGSASIRFLDAAGAERYPALHVAW
ncbi:MAG: hypothetical protein H0W82_06395 [Actinobacteria bacterium]|nr:hypothetical protein [Actinomycetota bacterium]